MTSESVAAVPSPILVIPVGSFEQHGPHLPLDTDSRIANALAERLVASLATRAVLGPTITVTASGEHQGFAGTLSIGTETTARVFEEIARSADWAAGIVFVNGHGGNADAIATARHTIDAEGRHALFWSPRAESGDDHHAGFTETSVLMHLDPTVVDTTRIAPGNTSPITEIASALRTRGVKGVSPTGILGDPTKSSAEHGRHVFERWASDLEAAVRSWQS